MMMFLPARGGPRLGAVADGCPGPAVLIMPGVCWTVDELLILALNKTITNHKPLIQW